MGKNAVNVSQGAGAAVAAPVQPRDLENALFRLLARLEQLLARLSEPVVLQKPSLVLQVAVAMLDQVVAFTGRWVDTATHGESLNKVLAAAREVYKAAEVLRSELTDSVVLSLLKLFAQNDASEADRGDLYRRTVAATCTVLDEAFALFTDCLGAPADRAGWEQAKTVFQEELAQGVSKIIS